MVRIGCALRARVAMLWLMTMILPSGSALAFTPEVGAAIARRVVHAPPIDFPAGALGDCTDEVVARQMLAAEADPEREAARHAFDGLGAGAFGAGVVPEAQAYVHGAAPHALAACASALRDAFAQRRASVVAEKIAHVAMIAAQLADPFQTSSPSLPPLDGLQASFSDIVGADALVRALGRAEAANDLRADAAESVAPEAAAEAAAAFCRESGTLREVVEAMHLAGDDAGIMDLRGEQIVAAWRFTRAIVRGAWQAAGRPSLTAALSSPGILPVWPNPSSGATTFGFALDAPTEVTLELFDAQGRRVRAWRAGLRGPGQHTLTLPEVVVRSLEAGTYFARVLAPGPIAAGRFVVTTR